MKVSSINGHVHPPAGAVCVGADSRQGWFVVSYQINGDLAEFFYNQVGREVFRVDYPRPTKLWAWERISRYLWKGKYANPDTAESV